MAEYTPDEEALRKLADAATPGPWEYEWDEAEGEITVRAGTALVGEDGFAPGSYFTSDMIIEHDDAWPEDSGEQYAANAEFIAAARTAVPALLDENAALRARIKAVRELHYPAHNNQDRTPFCPDCKGAPGVHECGCWRDKQESPVCGHCRGWKGVGPVKWPCPTIRALDGDA